MQHTSNHSRKYNLTRAGTRLARYLDYVADRPAVSAHLHFADIPAAPAVPPEQYDDDRSQPLPDTWNPRLTPWEDVPPSDDAQDDLISDDDDYGDHSPEED